MRVRWTLLPIILSGLAAVALVRLNVYADPDAFPVTGADEVIEVATAGSLPPDLETQVGQLSNGYSAPIGSDYTHWADLQAPTGTLSTLIEALPEGYTSVFGSDSTIWREFQAPPSILATLLPTLPEYLFPVYASDSTYLRSMAYPKLLLNDTTPPQISGFSYDAITGLLDFVTDEFAVNEIWYGDAFGNYTQAVTTSTWLTNTLVLLPGTDKEYALIHCQDRSGNIYDFYTPGFAISGLVLDEGGSAIPGAVVYLGPYQVTVTDDTGSFVLGGIPAGSHTLAATHADYEFDPISLSVAADTPGQDLTGSATTSFVYLPLVVR